MNDIIEALTANAVRCEEAAKLFKSEPLASHVNSLRSAIDAVGASWSRSWIGYHALVYLDGFRAPKQGEVFDPEWGLQESFSSRNDGPWRQYPNEVVVEEIIRRAGLTDMSSIATVGNQCRQVFEAAREDLLPLLDALLYRAEDAMLHTVRDQINELQSGVSAQQFAWDGAPKTVTTRDSVALAQHVSGVWVPPHIGLEARVLSELSHSGQVGTLGQLARRAERYLRVRNSVGGRTVATTTGTIFIGHGRSSLWREFKDFIQDNLHLMPDEFNRESAAGLSTIARLEQMLDKASFAFLILTAEDEHVDGSQHARENVIHELGLFQGRLGFSRAIVLLEDGCAEFSNITGLIQIRFPRGNIKSCSEEVRQVLKREGILPA